jgi:ABC-type branched-subunit amino acid transport system ATPase component
MEREKDVLEVRHLSIRFGSIGVLRDLTSHVPAGATLAILGPNGAGKTVLFKALIGAIAYEGGPRTRRKRSPSCSTPP